MKRVEMIAVLALLLALARVMRCEDQQAKSSGPVCDGSEDTGDIFTLTVDRRKNKSSGEWQRTFHARKVDTATSTGTLELEASQGSVECGGKTIMHVRVVVREVKEDSVIGSSRNKDDRLIFHPRHGKNAVILNNGRSLQKLDVDDPLNAVAFTNRPLKNNELFEVRLDKRIVKHNTCFALGVMIHSPDTVEIRSAMYLHKNGTWMYHNNAIYAAGKELSKYGRDLNKIQERERIGVMRHEDGSIHFFMNGIDLGRALANISWPVYGVFEAWKDAVKGTIVY